MNMKLKPIMEEQLQKAERQKVQSCLRYAASHLGALLSLHDIHKQSSYMK